MRVKTLHVSWLGPLAIAIGFCSGYSAYGKSRPAAAGPAVPAGVGAPASVAKTGSGAKPVAPDPADDKRRAELAGRKAALLAKIADLEARLPKPKTREERLALAAQVIAVMRRIAKKDRAAAADLLKLWRELDADLAARFIEEFDRETDAPVRSNWMMCVLACGGSDAAAFTLRILSDPGVTADDRSRISSFLDGAERGLVDLGRLPVTGALLDRAFALTQATSDSDRAAGAGLLGIAGTPAALEALRRAADVDKSLQVRESALRGLGRSGDEATLAWLEGDYLPRTESLGADLKAQTQFAAQAAIDALKRRLKK